MAKSVPIPAPIPPVTYEEHLRQALAHYQEPAWLAAHSPLAAPYWAGQPPAGTEAGTWLKQVLYETAVSLWGGTIPADKEALLAAVNHERSTQGKGNRYAFLILELHYFQHHFQIPKQNFIWEDYLFIGKSQYYRDLEGSVRLLGERLLERLRPSFRPERPIRPAPFVGRESLVATALGALTAGQDVVMSGASGMGKTSVGMTIASHWTEGATFWFTVRAGFNDQVQALLMALGYFLHEQGSSGLWRQVVAGKGQVENLNLAVALIQNDLAQLQPRRPMLCFDDIDRLRPADFIDTSATHEQMLEVIRGIHGHAPMLLVGQRAIAEADVYLTVDGLSLAESEELLHTAQVPFTAATVTHLHTYTGGNPRLLRLCASLTRNGTPLGNVLETLPSVPVLQTIFQRLWQGLSAAEQALVQQLSVFAPAAPVDAFAAQRGLIQQLDDLGVVEQRGDGSMALVPVIRDVVYPTLPTEAREQFHLVAAALHAERGQYTDAAHHYSQGGEPAHAVHLWYRHRELEILSGRAANALKLFRDLSARRLDSPTQEKLALIRGELHRFAGEPADALSALQSLAWDAESEFTPDAMLLEGKLQQGMGQHATALDTYEKGLESTTRLLRQRVSLEVQRGIAYLRQKEVQAAWREATLARYEAEHLQGMVQAAMGNFTTARGHYKVALLLADEAQYEQGAARTHYQLAGLAGRQNEPDTASHHLDHAIRHYESIGDLFTLECVRTSLAAVKIQLRDYVNAMALAKASLRFFEQIRHPYWVRVAATTLGEACYEAGQLEEAERAVRIVLNQDEPNRHAYALVTLGNIHRQRAQPNEAIAAYQQAITISANTEDSYIEAYAWRGLGEAYLQTGENDLGQSALAKAIALFRQLNLPTEIDTTQQVMKVAG
jgi:tetratricopeptide (TPR) repeat protein